MAGLLGLTICFIIALTLAKNMAIRLLCVVVYLSILYFIFHLSQDASSIDLDLEFLKP